MMGGSGLQGGILRATLGIGLLGLSGCGAGYEDMPNFNSSGTTIVCFGDSLTRGYGAGSGDDYPSVLSSLIGRPIINAGRNGDTSAQGLRRIQEDVLSKNPRIVLVEFGGNDYIQKVSKKETRDNLNEIIERCTESGAMVVLVHCKFGIMLSDPYLAMFRELSEQHHVLLIEDVLGDIFGRPSRMSDPIHPNSEGYALMAEHISDKLLPLIEAADANLDKDD